MPRQFVNGPEERTLRNLKTEDNIDYIRHFLKKLDTISYGRLFSVDLRNLLAGVYSNYEELTSDDFLDIIVGLCKVYEHKYRSALHETKLLRDANRLLNSRIKKSDAKFQNAKRVIALSKLDSISDLEDNWNENGAEHFSKSLIDKCREILSALDFFPEIFPVADGSIQFVYKENDGSYLEFDIFEDKIYEYRIYPNEEDEEQFIIGDQIPKIISKEVTYFYEHSKKRLCL